MYEIRFDSEAAKFLTRLPKNIGQRIFLKIHRAKRDPHRYFERLEGRPEFKLRVGEYRVIADIDDKNELLEIRLIGHRKNVYGR